MTPARLARRSFMARYSVDGRRIYRTFREDRIRAKSRRADLKARGLCINGEEHGPATHGVLCLKCREAHRKSS
jgi:hypothetical protein